MTSNVRTVAIAGAGIGGLAAALALARQGIASNVFERRAGISEDGAGIQIGPNGCRVLSELGVLDRVRVQAAEPDAISVHDGTSGRVLTWLPLGTWIRERHGASYLTLHRQDLHAGLREAAIAEPLITLRPGVEVTGFSNHPSGVEVTLSVDAPVTSDALVASDGLWSKLRAKVTDAPPVKPFGKCAYRAILPSAALPQGLTPNDVHIWLSPGAHAVHYPVRGGREIALVVIVDANAVENAWNIEAKPAWKAALTTAQFAPALLDLLSGAEHWCMWPLQTLPPLPRWTNGNVALLGDAAHPVLPFFAQGGAMALEDAAVLAANIANTTLSMPQRLRAYEQSRRARVARVAEASLSNGRIYHMHGAAAAARNAVLTSVPPHLLMRRYDWLYGWTP